jgi:hypothetical protein
VACQVQGIPVDQVKQLDEENRRLKTVVADQALDISILRDVARETTEPGRGVLRLSTCSRCLGSPSAGLAKGWDRRGRRSGGRAEGRGSIPSCWIR